MPCCRNWLMPLVYFSIENDWQTGFCEGGRPGIVFKKTINRKANYEVVYYLLPLLTDTVSGTLQRSEVYTEDDAIEVFYLPDNPNTTQ